MSKANRPDTIPVPRPLVPQPKPGPGGPGADPCEGPFEATFTSVAGVAIGTHVIVVPSGGELGLMAGSHVIGRLDRGAAFDRISGCIRAGWAFVGTVTEVAGPKGEVALGGAPTR